MRIPHRRAEAHDDQPLSELRDLHFCGIHDLVGDLVARFIKDPFHDLNDRLRCGRGRIRRIVTLPAEETTYILADDPTGLHDAGDTGEFVDQFVALVTWTLLAGVAESLAVVNDCIFDHVTVILCDFEVVDGDRCLLLERFDIYNRGPDIESFIGCFHRFNSVYSIEEPILYNL